MTSIEWLGMAPAARRLGISVRQLYDDVDQGRIAAQWVTDPLLRLEVAIGDGPAGGPTAGAAEQGDPAPRELLRLVEQPPLAQILDHDHLLERGDDVEDLVAAERQLRVEAAEG